MSNLRQHQPKQAGLISQKQSLSRSSQAEVHPVQKLQGIVGNKAVGDLLRSRQNQEGQPCSHEPVFRGLSHELAGGMVQAKLTIGRHGDRYEQEADRVAQHVVRQMNAPEVSPSQLETPVSSHALMRKADGTGGEIATSAEFEASLNQERGRGQPLAKGIRAPMERSFGRDLSAVRVHENSSSHALNKAIQAKAFTTGQDVFFRQGAYQPGSQEGKRLIAHELTHVMQQDGKRPQIQRKKTETPRYEREPKTKGEGSKKGEEYQIGLEIAAKKIVEADPGILKEAYETLIKAGLSTSRETTNKDDRHTSSTRERKREDLMGYQSTSEASIEVNEVIDSLNVLVKSSHSIGGGDTTAKTIARNAGQYRTALEYKLEDFIGFSAKVQGKLTLDKLSGLIASAEAEAAAGISGSLSGSAAMSRRNLGGIKLEGEGESFAGAQAAAKAQVSASANSFSASAKAEAFAGVKGSVTGKGSITSSRGNKLAGGSIGLSGSLGVGAKEKHELSYKAGKLKIGAGLGGTVGIGGDVEFEYEIDFREIRNALEVACSSSDVTQLMSRTANQRPNVSEDRKAEMQKELNDAFSSSFYKYAFHKAQRVKSGKAKHYAKRQEVQQIIAEQAKGSDKLTEFIWYKESDEELAKIAYESTKLAAEDAGLSTLAANSQQKFQIRRGIIIFWPYKD